MKRVKTLSQQRRRIVVYRSRLLGVKGGAYFNASDVVSLGFDAASATAIGAPPCQSVAAYTARIVWEQE
jgi:hypothetical protein